MQMSRLLVPTMLAFLVAGVVPFSSFSGATQSERTVQAEEKPAGKDPKIERGKYVAHQVAMCVYCHSPRDAGGEPIATRLFLGSPLPIAPTLGHDWAVTAPNLRSIAEIWGEEDLAKFLQTGVPPRGAVPRLPMPPFRMNAEDAAAVAAYLRSLK